MVAHEVLGGAATAKPHSHASASGRIASAANTTCPPIRLLHTLDFSWRVDLTRALRRPIRAPWAACDSCTMHPLLPA